MFGICCHQVFFPLFDWHVIPNDEGIVSKSRVLGKGGPFRRRELLLEREGVILAKDYSGGSAWAGVIGSMLDNDPPTTKALARLSQGLHCVPGSAFIRFWTSVGSASSHSYL